MDKDGIDSVKLNNSIADILERYGVQVRGGRCKAICHHGSRYTAKVSHDIYYCFKCDKSMDVFDITMHFTGCDFTEAYELLGGTDEISFSTRVILKQKQAAKKIMLNRQQKLETEHRKNLMYITAYQGIIGTEEPFSDLWCHSMNKLIYQFVLLEEYINVKGAEKHGRGQ